MSKKYDEYVKKVAADLNLLYPYKDKVVPMIPERDPELDREIRDRAIISAVTIALKNGKELSYGEIRLLVDDDPSEMEYEGKVDLSNKKEK